MDTWTVTCRDTTGAPCTIRVLRRDGGAAIVHPPGATAVLRPSEVADLRSALLAAQRADSGDAEWSD